MNQFGDKVFFDANGDPPASYDVINWQLIDGQVQHVTLGHFASDDSGQDRLTIQEERIVWRTGNMVHMVVHFEIVLEYNRWFDQPQLQTEVEILRQLTCILSLIRFRHLSALTFVLLEQGKLK